MIVTAGADRLQEGMKKTFGKPVCLATSINRGDVVFGLSTKSGHLSTAYGALNIAASKLSAPMEIVKTQFSAPKVSVS